jgi:HEAT repeat protein
MRISRGIVLPSLGQLLVLAAGSTAAWLAWTQFRDPDLISAPAAAPAADPAEKLRMTEQLANFGAEAVPELALILADPDPLMRRNALLGLARIGPEAGPAIDDVRARLADEKSQVRQSAISAFWRISRDPPEAGGPIARMLADPDFDVRAAAAGTLEAIGRPVAGPVSEMLSSDAEAARALALRVLRKTGWDSAALEIDDTVRRLFDDPDPGIGLDALSTLVMRGSPRPDEIRELLQKRDLVVIRGERRFPRFAFTAMDVALQAIARTGPQAAEFLPDILALLRAEEHQPDAAAIFMKPASPLIPALCAMKSAARPALPFVLARIENLPDAYSRVSAARTLFEIGMDPDELTSFILPFLDDRDLMVCLEAGRVLALVNPPEARRQVSRLIPRLSERPALFAVEGLAAEAAEAVPALIPLIDSADPVASSVAASTLGGIGPDAAPAVPALVARLARDAIDPTMRETGFIEALVKIGPAARSAVPALVVIVSKSGPAGGPRADSTPATKVAAERSGRQARERILLAAIEALGEFRDGAPSTLSVLRKQLKSRLSAVRIAALGALVRIGESSPELLEDVIDRLEDRALEVRAHAALAIGGLAGDRRAAVVPLTRALAEDNTYVRTAAAQALGKIGADAASAVPALRQMLEKRGNVLANAAVDPALGLPAGWTFRLPQLDALSVAAAVRTALSEIERSDFKEKAK